MAKDLNRSIKIYIDSSDAMKKSKDLETRMSKLRDRLQELHAQGKKDTPEYARTEKALQQLSTSYGRYQEKLKETERILKNLSGATEAELLSVRNQLRQDLKKTTRDTDEYKAKLEALTAVEKELANVTREMQGEMGSQATMWDRASSKLNGLKVAVVGFLSSIILDKAVNDFATLDDKFADVMKTTGQTREEVVVMNEEFKKIDTRTTTTGLNDIAEEAGRIDIAKDEVLDFVKAMDIANVALGDSFSGGASEIANTLGKLKFLFKETQEMGVEKAYLSIASAINELGANGVASEVNIANFTTRIGSMPAALKPSIADTLALGAAFEESGIEAEVASRAYSIMLQKASTDTAGFARVMKISKQEVEDLINTNPVEFFLKFSESMKGMSATDTSKTLKELKVNADGVNKVIGAASENTDRFRELLDLSNASFKEGISVINEFNIKNNTFGAQLDKSKKILQDYIYELGSRLAPIVKDGLVAGGSLIKILSTITGFLFDNGKAILTVVGAIAAYNAGLKLTIYWETINNSLQAISKMRLAEKALAQALSTGNTTRAAAAERLYAASMTQSNAVARAYTSVVSLLSAAKYLLTGNITKARQALIAFQVVSKLNPAGLMTTAVLGLVAAFGYLLYKTNQVVTAQKAIKKATEELNGELAREQSEANKLFEALKRTNPQSEERKKLTEQIIEKYGPYLKGLVDEKGRLIDIANAQEIVNTKIRESISLEIKQSATKAIQTEGIKKQIESVDEVVSMMQKQLGESFSTEAGNAVRENIHRAIDKSIAEGKTGMEELTKTISDVIEIEGADIREKTGFWDPKSLYMGISSVASVVYQTNTEIDKVENRFKGLIDQSKAIKIYVPKRHDSGDGDGEKKKPTGDSGGDVGNKKSDRQSQDLKEIDQWLLLETNKRKQAYVEQHKDKERYEKELQDLELEAINRRLALTSLDAEKRAAIEQAFLDWKIRLHERELQSEEAKQRRKAELEKWNEEETKAIVDAALKAVDEQSEKEVLALMENRANNLISEQVYQDQLLDIERRALEERLRINGLTEKQIASLRKTQLEKQIKDNNEAQQKAMETAKSYANVGQDFATELGNILTDSMQNAESSTADFQYNMLMLALDTLRQIVLLATAEAIAKEVGSKGIAGIATGAAAAAAINIAFAAVKGLIKRPSKDSSSSTTSSGSTGERVYDQRATGKYDVIGADDGKLYRNVPYNGVATTGIVSTPTLMGEQGSELVVSHPDFLALRKHINYPLIVSAIQDVRSGRIPQRADGKYDKLEESAQSTPDENNVIAIIRMLIPVMKQLLEAINTFNNKKLSINYFEWEETQKKVERVRNGAKKG